MVDKHEKFTSLNPVIANSAEEARLLQATLPTGAPAKIKPIETKSLKNEGVELRALYGNLAISSEMEVKPHVSDELDHKLNPDLPI